MIALPVLHGLSTPDVLWEAGSTIFQRFLLEIHCVAFGTYGFMSAFWKSFAYGLPQAVVIVIVLTVFFIMKVLMRLNKLAGVGGKERKPTAVAEAAIENTSRSVEQVGRDVTNKLEKKFSEVEKDLLEALKANQMNEQKLAKCTPDELNLIAKTAMKKMEGKPHTHREGMKQLKALLKEIAEGAAPQSSERRIALSETSTEKFVLRLFFIWSVPRFRFNRLRHLLYSISMVLCVVLLSPSDVLLLVISQYVRIAQKALRALDSSWEDCERCIETIVLDVII